MKTKILLNKSINLTYKILFKQMGQQTTFVSYILQLFFLFFIKQQVLISTCKKSMLEACLDG